jgi:uncharacterized membrane protein
MARKITSFKKALSWRLISIVISFTISLIFFEEIEKIVAFNICYHLMLTILYYFHERLWDWWRKRNKK